MADLFEKLLQGWPMAKQNFEALKSVKSKAIDMGNGRTVYAQFNPARIRSTGAKLDAKSLEERPCFLCEDKRPAEQSGREWGDYTILINPYPIFPRHFTIPVREHTPQRIKGRVCDMAELAQTLPAYTIFYNGPRCGASAPDHMHFQAGNSDFLPIWNNLGEIEMVTENVGYPSDSRGLPGIIVITGYTTQEIYRTFDKIWHFLPQAGDEPMMNLLCASVGGKLMLLILPRTRLRPSFYGEGDGQMIISPASVDLAGVFITPRPQDYESINAETVQRLYDELCMNPEEVKHLLNEYADCESRNTLEQEDRVVAQW